MQGPVFPVSSRDRISAIDLARLTLFANFELKDKTGAACPVSAKRNRALLAILALSPKGQCTREMLCSYLWGDRGEEQARSSLRQSLAHLRKELGTLSSILVSRDEFIQLDLASCWVDAVEFGTLARSADRDSLSRAAELFRGSLLADLSLKQPGFDEWLDMNRRETADLAIRVFESLAAEGEPRERLENAKRLVGLDSLREESVRALMRAYRDTGETALAVKQYESLRDVLKTELGSSPSDATMALRKSLDRAAPEDEPAPAESGLHMVADNPKLAIAVLPFKPLSDEMDQHYLADGISEDIVTGLARFRSLAVISRNSSFRFRGDVDAREAGRKLGARYLVEGSLGRRGSRLRISVQLVDAVTTQQAWAEFYDVADNAFFAVQDEIVAKVVGTLAGRVADASVHHARLKPRSSLAAYELVLKANALNWETREAKEEALGLLQRALDLDPGYAVAHALTAAIRLRQAAYHERLTPSVLDEVLDNARRSVELDPNDSACQSILGWVLIARRDCVLAEEHIKRAQLLNPNNPYAMVNMGSLLVQTGHPEEALVWFERAQKTDPFFHPSWVFEKFAHAHFTARRYEAAANYLGRAPKLRFYMHALLAGLHAKQGLTQSTQQHAARAISMRPDLSISMMQELLPYRDPVDAAHLAEILSLAGFT